MDNDKVRRLLAYQGGADLTSTDGLKILGKGPAVKSDTRSNVSKAWDTINPLDNGRSWSNPTPKNNKSIVKQIPDAYVVNALGLQRSLTGTAQGISGFIDLVTPGRGTSGVTKKINRFAELTDQAVKQNNLDQGTYQISQVANDVAQFFIPGAAAPKVASKIPMATKIGSIISKVPGASKILPRLANVSVDVAQGAGQRSAREQDVSLGTVGTDAAISAGLQGAGDLVGVGLRKFLSKETNPSVVRQAVESVTGTSVDDKIINDLVNATDEAQIDEIMLKLRQSEVNTNAKSAVKDPANARTIATTPDGRMSPDALSTVIETMVKTNKPRQLKSLVSQVFPELPDAEVESVSRKLARAKNDIDVSNILIDSMENRPNQIRTDRLQENTVKIEDTTVSPENMAKAKEATSIDTPNQSGTSETATVNTAQASDASLGTQTNKVADDASDAIKNAPETVKQTIADINNSLGDMNTTARRDKKMLAKQRAERAAATLKVDPTLTGSARVAAERQALAGSYERAGWQGVLPEVEPEVRAQKFEEVLDHMLNTEYYSNKRFERQNLDAALRRVFGMPDLDGKIAPPTPGMIKRIKKDFGSDFAETVEALVDENVSFGQKITGILADLSGVPKGLMATGDLSYGLRQGAPLGARFPKEWAIANKEAIKFVKDPTYMANKMTEIQGWKDEAGESIYDVIANEMKVELSAMNVGEETMAGVESLKGKIFKKLGTSEDAIKKIEKWDPTEAANRAYSGAATMQRSLVAKKIIDSFGGVAKMKETLDEKAIRDLGRVINSATGAGEYGKTFQKFAPALGKTLFAPRLWKSKLDMLNPVYYAKLSPQARKLALQTNASFIGVVGAVLGAASAAGADIETDARSADFMKIKVGNTRYDIMGGLQQNLVAAWRLASGEKKNSMTGEVKELGKDYGGASRLSVITDMFQNKANPLLGTAARLIEGKDKGGNEINPLTEIGKLFIPLGIQGLWEASKDTGSVAKGALLNAPGFFGAGVQTYGGTPSKNTAGTKENPKWKGEIPENFVTDKNGEVIFDKDGKPVEVEFEKDATSLEKQALIDDKRRSALTESFKAGLPREEQTLLNLSQDNLDRYLSDGKITQEQYDTIEQYKVDLNNIEGVEVPEGIKSTNAKSFYEKYNSMSKKAQEEYLKGAPDENATKMVERINSQLPEGITKLNPSNEIAKMYADFESNLNTKGWSDIDRFNEEKKFLVSVIKKDKDPMTNNIYTEGPSKDMEYFIQSGAVTKEELDRAIRLDDELYKSGLAGQKFSNKFRRNFGYGELSSGSGSGSGGGSRPKSLNINVSSFLPSGKDSGPGFKPVSTRSRVAVKRTVKKPTRPNKRVSIKL